MSARAGGDGSDGAATKPGAPTRDAQRQAGRRPPEPVTVRVRRRLAADGGDMSPLQLAAAVRAVGQDSFLPSDLTVLHALRDVERDLLGAGPLQPLLDDPTVTDVLVNGVDGVFVDRGQGLERTCVQFRDDAEVRRLAQRLACAAGRRLDDAQPFVDAPLTGGTRLHAVLPPVAPDGTHLSLRVPRRRAFALDELVSAGTCSASTAALLAALVRTRVAFLVSGGTGSGKTTLLSALLGLADPAERVALIEDVGELRPTLPHVVRLQSRPANLEGQGAVSLRDLVRQALRMRPDRIVVGEVRGAEVTELLAALNTGHEGGCGTVHANGADDVPARLEALAATAGRDRAWLHSQLAAALSVIVHVVRGGDGVRRVAEVRLLSRGPDGLVVALPALEIVADEPRPGTAYDALCRLLHRRGEQWSA